MRKQNSKTLNFIKRSVLALLKQNPGVPLPRKQISHFLNVRKNNYYLLEEALSELCKEGALQQTRGHNYVYRQISHFTGELRTTRAGFGFVVVENQENDIFVSRDNLNTAFDRDIVEIQLYAQTRGKRQEGFITRVVKRFRDQIVGTYHHTEFYSYVVPDSPKIYRDIMVAADKTLGARDGQKVLVSFDSWEGDQHNPEGTITEILGDPDTPGVDVISVAYSYNLPVSFSKDVEKEALEIPAKIGRNDLKDRLDLRDLICFTIDPVDARDFDDAISLEKLPNGNMRLGVHIADVSHYVKPGTLLDKEAFRRGTSIYLVDRVIPMLPERLSGDLCSLKPDSDRLTFSCIMDISTDLKVMDYNISPSIIHSKRRYNYEEFQTIYDEKKADPNMPVIEEMYVLSHKLTQQRFAKGSIDFETPEVRFVLDEKGKPSEIIPKKRLDSHRLVEEFMLLANRTVAGHIRNISPVKSHPLPFLYRIHEKPDSEKMAKFYDFLSAIGVKFKPVKRVTSRFFQNIIESIKGTPEENIIEEIALRSMMKAIYSENNLGHFGLAFDNYTHFTSPIRRYPDLTVHRLLRAYASDEIDNPKKVKKQLQETAIQSTKMERLAQEAERESIKLKQAEYIQQHIGDIFHGIISGVTSFGIFVELEHTFIEGFVQMTNMSDDYYIYDEATYSMTGRHTGRFIRLGDQVEVKVVAVNLEKREIEFMLLEDPDFEPLVLDQVQALNETPEPKRRKRKNKNRKQS